MNLQEEAEKYSQNQKFEGYDTQMRRETFTRYSLNKAYEAGATSKYAESEKLKFAINELQKQNDYNEGFAQEMCLKRILELQQKLKDLENE